MLVVKGLCYRVLLLAAIVSTVSAHDAKTADVKYVGVITNPPGKGALAEINPWSHFYACFEADGEMLIGEIFSWTWNDMFRRVRIGTTMKARHDSTHIWMAWPTGKEVRFKKDSSKTAVVESCSRRIQRQFLRQTTAVP